MPDPRKVIKNEPKIDKTFWHFYSFKIPSSIEQKKGVKTSIWQIHSGKSAPSWMIKFTKNSGLSIQNQIPFPPEQKVIIERDNLFDKWHDVINKANLSKSMNGSFNIWVNGKKQLNYKGLNLPPVFKRFITKDLFEGSVINIRLIDKTIQNSLKTNHRVKFNRG